MNRRPARIAALLLAVGGASLLSPVPAAAQVALTTTPVPTTPIAGDFTLAAVGDLICLRPNGRHARGGCRAANL